jgi:hypothetical protein
MNDELPLVATNISIISRLIFMWLLYTNKSTNTYSLIFCILSIISSSMWLKYAIDLTVMSLIFRSSSEIVLLSVSMIYILRNKIIKRKNQTILPI